MDQKPTQGRPVGTGTVLKLQGPVKKMFARVVTGMMHSPYSIYKTIRYTSSPTGKYVVVRLGFWGI
ncbi:MAG: hypothetical protein ABL983_19640, partial [Nitrospira sp.]